MAKPSVDEFGLIDLIKNKLGKNDSSVLVGIGDDAAVCMPPRGRLLFCSDAMVEGTHFKLEWITPEELGHKALASALSDIAAMNGKPLYALVSLALRENLPSEFVARFYDGLAKLACKYEVQVVGGDLAKSKQEIFIDVSVIGEAENPVTRAGACIGDFVVVSGTPGLSAAALDSLQNGFSLSTALRRAHLTPEPRFDLTAKLQAPGLLTSMIDISDGLASELHHLARESKCGFLIDQKKLPLHPEMQRLAMSRGLDATKWTLAGGEDYELLFTTPQKQWEQMLQSHSELRDLTSVIGEVRPAHEGVQILTAEGTVHPLKNQGWNHFA